MKVNWQRKYVAIKNKHAIFYPPFCKITNPSDNINLHVFFTSEVEHFPIGFLNELNFISYFVIFQILSFPHSSTWVNTFFVDLVDMHKGDYQNSMLVDYFTNMCYLSTIIG